jgi:hypothetical protein
MADLTWLDTFADDLKSKAWEDKQKRMKEIYDIIVNPKRDDEAEAKERRRLLGLD